VLLDLKVQSQATVADIRRLVYELRPPALDELGLVAALRAHIPRADGLRITIDSVPQGLPTLSAAVEVAAYRIALEAVTNVVRHANARQCAITLTADRDLRVEVSDDGRGLPDGHSAGVGLTSMRERAAELGGTCVIERNPAGGTRVVATLPVTGGT